MKDSKLLEFLRELRDSYENQYNIFTHGSCYRLYKIIKTFNPEVIPYYSEIKGHWIIKTTEGGFFDIGGELSKSYVEVYGFEEVTDPIKLASAYIPKTKNGDFSISCDYDKYIKV